MQEANPKTGTGVQPTEATAEGRIPVSLRDLCMYFFKLGSIGFGGPIALAGYMKRDLEEERHWLTPDEYQDGLAIAQTMPGPLAAQLAMWIGFIRYGVLGATLTGFLFIITPFLIVLGVAALYVALQGLPVIRALFYGIGPAAIAIVTLAAWRLAKGTNGKDAKLWATSIVLMLITIVTQTELAWLFIVAGLLAIAVYAPPWRRAAPAPRPGLAGLVPFPLPLIKSVPLGAAVLSAGTLVTLTLFFLKASAFTFGSGLAIVPFLHEGVVAQHHWVGERQFLDAVAMGLITPGPVVIMATFVGYLAAGVIGSVLATFAVFAPVWVFNVIIGRLFLRHRRNPQVRAFVKGATAAAVGAIAGAAVILAQGGFIQRAVGRVIHWDLSGAMAAVRQPGQGALVDWITVLIFLIALVVLYYRKLKEPYVVGLAAIAGLALFRFHA
jgi:chromate transporter